MKIYLFLVFTLLAGKIFAGEKPFLTGEIFDGDKKVYTYERYKKVEAGQEIDRAVYKDMSGEVALEEKMIMKGDTFVRYEIDQKQLKQQAWIKSDSGKIYFDIKKFRKRKTGVEYKMPSPFLMGMNIAPTIIKQWASLVGGKKFSFKLGVWHRQEAMGFALTKDKVDGKETVFSLSPTSMLVRAVVSPVKFHFDTKTKKLTKIVGRVVPKKKSGRGWKSFDGVSKFTWVK